MGILIFTGIFVCLVIVYVFYSSYLFQLYYKRSKLSKKIISEILKNVKGEYIKSAYFGSSHRIVKLKEFKALSKRHQILFSKCYNVILFRTPDAHFEFFYHMVKEGVGFTEILNIRVFPKENKIRSEGNVEKNYSRVNIFTNNRYLTGILESIDCQEQLKDILRANGDILLISENNLHYKIFLKPSELKFSRLIVIVKSLNYIKDKIYRKGIIEY